jgi:hypothetical protein
MKAAISSGDMPAVRDGGTGAIGFGFGEGTVGGVVVGGGRRSWRASKDGEPISHSNFRRRGWNKAVKRAGLSDGPKITPHDARPAFASQMAELGLSSSDVSACLGNSTAGVTERIYTHAFNREAREQRVREAMAAAISGRDSVATRAGREGTSRAPSSA